MICAFCQSKESFVCDRCYSRDLDELKAKIEELERKIWDLENPKTRARSY